jgi:hypothetical protein
MDIGGLNAKTEILNTCHVSAAFTVMVLKCFRKNSIQSSAVKLQVETCDFGCVAACSIALSLKLQCETLGLKGRQPLVSNDLQSVAVALSYYI